MNCPALGLRVASVIFGLVGLLHLIRIFCAHLSIQVCGCYVGRRWSIISVIVLAALCIWMWKLASQVGKSKTETPPAATPPAGPSA